MDVTSAIVGRIGDVLPKIRILAPRLEALLMRAGSAGVANCAGDKATVSDAGNGWLPARPVRDITLEQLGMTDLVAMGAPLTSREKSAVSQRLTSLTRPLRT